MNRTDRLLAIVLELQARRRATAEGLARTFEVTKRTIYRDVAALVEAGVPVVSAPGQGYWLMEGYFLPPLHVTAVEATLLLLGAGVVAGAFDAHYREAAEAAARKIEGALPPATRDEVDALRDRLHLVERLGETQAPLLDRLATLRGAVMGRRRVTFAYETRGGERSVRRVDPHGLVALGGVWLLSGWCHAREAFRTFRLSRMADLRLTGERFERRATPPARDVAERRDLTVRARLTPEASRWLDETPSYYLTGREHRPGGTVVTLRSRRVEEVLPWLLGWGSALVVLEPESVRARLRREAEGMLAAHRAPAAPRC